VVWSPASERSSRGRGSKRGAGAHCRSWYVVKWYRHEPSDNGELRLESCTLRHVAAPPPSTPPANRSTDRRQSPRIRMQGAHTHTNTRTTNKKTMCGAARINDWVEGGGGAASAVLS
jgi:hypothetical protein